VTTITSFPQRTDYKEEVEGAELHKGGFMATTVATKLIHPQVSLKNILYATDFSRYSDAALPFALSLAGKYGSRIFAVHIISVLPFPSTPPTQAVRAVAAQAVREARETMERVQARCKEIPHEALIRKGEIWSELAKIVKEKAIDLVVCGTHGRTGVNKMLLGSVAENIYRHAPCPVLTVGPNVVGEPEGLGDIHTILYPTDFTAESLAAVPYAVSLAKENQARLYLLHVTEVPISAAVEEEVACHLRDLIPRDVELSCAPKAFVEVGDPAHKITELAEELMVDLIILGPRRTSRFPGTSHLPATASYVVSRAICPVLTTREPLGHASSR
jgi:nucleotide-binding universal stress UspA family protein